MNARILLASALVCCYVASVSGRSLRLTEDGAAEDDDEDPLKQDLFRSQLSYGTILISLAAALSAGGGLGGGGLYLPIFVLVLGYDPHTAIPLSKATIVGVAYGGYLFNYRRRHPLADRPLIDYDLALLFQPMLLVGTIIGVTLNVFFPALIITILLTILLVVVAYRTLKKGIFLYREETKLINEGGTSIQGSHFSGHEQKYNEQKQYFKVDIPASRSSHPSQRSSPRFAEESRESLVASSPPAEAYTEQQVLVLEDQLMHARESYVTSTPQGDRSYVTSTPQGDSGSGVNAAQSPVSWASESDPNTRLNLSVFDATASGSQSSSKRAFSSVDEGSSFSSSSFIASSEDGSPAGVADKKHKHAPSFDSDVTNSPGNISVPEERQAGGLSGKLAYSEELQKILAEESSTSWLKFALAAFILIFVIVIALLKGASGDEPSIIGVHCGTPEWWVLLLISLPVLAACTFGLARYTVRRARRKDELGYPYVNGDIRWTNRTAITYPLFAAFAGTAAGCLGIGGGLVLGPLLLEIGVYPPVLSATSAFTIIFTSTSITAQFLILGRVPLLQGAWYCGVGFFSAIIGHMWVKAMVTKYRKASLVSLALGAAVGVSAAVLIGSQILQVANEPIDLSFHSLCSGSAH